MNADQKIIIVEGNIGAGKSTFLKVITEYLNVQVVPEPIDEWQLVGTENLLEKFYHDTARWAYTFQSYAFVTRIRKQQAYAQKNKYATQVLERSVYSDRFCFARNCYERGFMSQLEWKLYQEWFSWLVDSYMPRPHGFVYLRTTPETCFERLRKRNRSEEEGISLEYLTQLYTFHEQWLIEKKDIPESLATIPVLSVPCDKDFEYDRVHQEQVVELVAQFIDGLTPGGINPASRALSL